MIHLNGEIKISSLSKIFPQQHTMKKDIVDMVKFQMKEIVTQDITSHHGDLS